MNIDNFPTAHKELRASPRNPNVDTESKSEKSANFEVWCLAAEIWEVYYVVNEISTYVVPYQVKIIIETLT